MALGLCVLFVWLGVWVFRIEKIEVEGSHVQVIVDEKRISRNLLFFPSEAFRSEILADNPWLSDIQFQKKFPHTLRIIPRLRTPYAILLTSDRIVLLDSEGMVLTYGDTGADLPRIHINIPNLRIGQIVTDTRAQFTLELIRKLKDTIVVHSVTESDGSYVLVKSEQLNIFIPQDKPVGESIATLQTLLAGFRIKGTLPTVVDLRFDKPIIKF